MVTKKHKLHKTLRKDFKDIPKKKKIDLDEWAVVNVSPSVVANPYLPALRVFTYNVTSYNAGTEEVEKQKRKGSKRKHSHRGGKPKNCKKKKNRERWECRTRREDWHSDEEAPSRTNRLWTPLGYTQVSICLSSPILGR